MDFMDFTFVLQMIIAAFEVSDVNNFFYSTFTFPRLIEIEHVSRLTETEPLE